MSTDRTQQQSPDELVQAKDLSLQSNRPPIDLPGYEAKHRLGQGAFGEVWIAVDRNTGRRVAIKFYTKNYPTRTYYVQAFTTKNDTYMYVCICL